MMMMINTVTCSGSGFLSSLRLFSTYCLLISYAIVVVVIVAIVFFFNFGCYFCPTCYNCMFALILLLCFIIIQVASIFFSIRFHCSEVSQPHRMHIQTITAQGFITHHIPLPPPSPKTPQPPHLSPLVFQDVHVMIFIGFGFPHDVPQTVRLQQCGVSTCS